MGDPATQAQPRMLPSRLLAACFSTVAIVGAVELRSTFIAEQRQLPTHSRCQVLCPNCTSPSCKCDGCWPGFSLTDTPDHTCDCFAELDFCAAGEKPIYTPGKKCPSCWPAENKACDCFAAIGFCEPSAQIASLRLASATAAGLVSTCHTLPTTPVSALLSWASVRPVRSPFTLQARNARHAGPLRTRLATALLPSASARNSCNDSLQKKM